MLNVKITGTLIAFGERSFKNQKGEDVTYHDLSLADPDDQEKKMQTYTTTKEVVQTLEDSAGVGFSLEVSGVISNHSKYPKIGETYKRVDTLRVKITDVKILK